MEEIKVYAPVIIGTLCRFEHFKRCIESLSKCTHAENTEIYIGLDFPISNSHIKGYREIVEYLENSSLKFKKINVYKRKHNLGASENFQNLRVEVAKKFDRYIISEDDNEFSPNFLDYMNKNLDKYKNNKNILAICGYNYPIEIPKYKNNMYFSSEFSAWGYGTWVEEYEFIRNNLFTTKYINTTLFSLNKVIRLLLNRNGIISGFCTCYKNKKILGDTFILSYQILNKKYSVHPKISLVRNHGHDGTGIHCGKSSEFKSQIIDTDLIFQNSDNLIVKPNQYINRKLRIWKKFKIKSLLIELMRYILLRKEIQFQRK